MCESGAVEARKRAENAPKMRFLRTFEGFRQISSLHSIYRQNSYLRPLISAIECFICYIGSHPKINLLLSLKMDRLRYMRFSAGRRTRRAGNRYLLSHPTCFSAEKVKEDHQARRSKDAHALRKTEKIAVFDTSLHGFSVHGHAL